MFASLSSSFLSLLLLLNVFSHFGRRCVVAQQQQHQQQSWEPMKYKIHANHETRQLLNVSYVRFKKTRYIFYSSSFSITGCTEQDISQEECSNNCFEEPKCIVWGWRASHSLCRCYSKHPREIQDAFIPAEIFQWTSYEIQSPCTDNLNLCEHGSICIPNRANKTYKCINCLPPYTGIFCNETGAPTPPGISKDLLYGRNQSCRALNKNFNVSRGGIYWIHPWRDERKIKVNCVGDATRIINMSFHVSQTSFRPIKDTDLEDGLNLYSRNYRADSTFLNKLDKLIFLRNIAFYCRHWNGTHNVNYRLGGGSEAYNFFALKSDQRPTSNSMTLTSDVGSTDFTLADGKYSNPSVSDEKRLVREIFVTGGGFKLDIMTESRVCFYDVNSWIQYFVEVW